MTTTIPTDPSAPEPHINSYGGADLDAAHADADATEAPPPAAGPTYRTADDGYWRRCEAMTGTGRDQT